MPAAEDAVLVQVRRQTHAEESGAISFLNTSNQTVQRSYSVADLGIEESAYLYNWQDGSLTEPPMTEISVTLPGHYSALYFFSHEPIHERPLRLPS